MPFERDDVLQMLAGYRDILDRAAPVGDHAAYKEGHARTRRVLTKLFTARRVQQARLTTVAPSAR
jgi:hypothetical protein